jgi:hypothetical protein
MPTALKKSILGLLRKPPASNPPRRSHREAIRYLVELGGLRSRDADRIMPPLASEHPYRP